MLRELLTKYLHIPKFIVGHPFGVLIVGAVFLLVGVSANLWRLLSGNVINLVDWDDFCVYIGIILVALSLASIF